MALKIIFAGTPDFAVPSLEALLASSHQVVAVYTQPDRPAGRGRKSMISAVKACALESGVPVEQPLCLSEKNVQDRMASYGADVMVVVAYGLLLPQAVLDAFPLGCINVHASLLPRWRGAAPIQYALLAGDDMTGVTIMQMTAGMDEGPIVSQAVMPIRMQHNARSLHDELAKMGSQLLLPTLEQWSRGEGEAKPQSMAAVPVTYAPKLSKQSAKIDWTESADVIARQVRAYYGWPVAFCDYAGQTLRIWQVEIADVRELPVPVGHLLRVASKRLVVRCGQGALYVNVLQLPGRNKMTAADFLNASPKFDSASLVD